VGARRLLRHAALVLTATHVAHARPFAAAGAALWEFERFEEPKKTRRNLKIEKRPTDLGPGAKPPLGFVALVGGAFSSRGNRVAAGTLGQITVLWKGRHTHTHTFMQR